MKDPPEYEPWDMLTVDLCGPWKTIIEDENSSKFKELVDQARKQSDENEAITKTEEITVTEI